MQNVSYKNEVDLHENKPVGGKHFPMNGFARSFVLTHRQKATWNWPVQKRVNEITCTILYT